MVPGDAQDEAVQVVEYRTDLPLLTHGRNRYLDLHHLRELVNQDISAIQKLMAIYDFFIDAAQQQKALFLEIQNAGGGEVHEKIILDVGGKLIPYISQIIKEGKKNGELSCEAPDLVSHFCVSGMIQVLNAVPADQKIQFMTDNRKIFIGLFVRILEIKEC